MTGKATLIALHELIDEKGWIEEAREDTSTTS